MIRYFLIALAITIIDQITKKIILSTIAYREVIEVFAWFDLVHIHNKGAAFSLFASAEWANVFLFIIGVFAIVLFSLWLGLWSRQEPWQNRLALAFILGGASGNIIDRLQFGYVVDFISIHYKDLYYPSFNVADSAISLGVVFMIFGFLRKKENIKSEDVSTKKPIE